MSVAPKALTAALAAWVAAAPGPLRAQMATGGLTVQSFRFLDAEEVGLSQASLIAMPVSVEAALFSRATVRVDAAFARAWASMAGGETGTAQGLSDTGVRVETEWRGVGLAVSAWLPTGDAERSSEEAAVIGTTMSDLLPFERVRWGAGLGLGADAAYSLRFPGTRVTLSAGYALAASYRPLDFAAESYEPGGQVRARAVVDADVGAASVLSVLVGYQRFGTDTFGAEDFLSPGNRVEASVSYALPLGARESAQLYGGFYHRAGGAAYTGLDGVPTPVEALLPGAGAPRPRQVLLAGAELSIVRGRLRLHPRTDLRVMRSSSGVGQGWLASLEGHGEYLLAGQRLGGGIVLLPTVAVRLGRVIAEQDAESALLGWQAGLSVRWSRGG